MTAAIVALLLAGATPAAQPTTEPVEITVTAQRGRCRLQLADREISEAALGQQARGWQGVPVRVIHPRGAGYKCLARIAFKLGEQGVTLIEYVDPPSPDDAPALDSPVRPR